MRLPLLIRKISCTMLFAVMISMISMLAYAELAEADDEITIDRIQLVTQQINLLKNRLEQGERELSKLQQQHDKEISQLSLQKANKGLLDKTALDISVAQTNLDGVSIELTDSQQNIVWIEKNIQAIENQLNVLGIFGLKVAKNEIANLRDLRSNLSYQQKLLELEKIRVKFLQNLQSKMNGILQLKRDRYVRLGALLKSRKMTTIKQQQVRDELAYQEQQNHWLQELTSLYARLAKTDATESHDKYVEIERDIFYANENANFAYIQSLIVRYKDQLQQMKLMVVKSNSISLLNEIGDQIQLVTKQISRLDNVLKSRNTVLQKHIAYLSQKKSVEKIEPYIKKLNDLEVQYKSSDEDIIILNKNLLAFRVVLDKALQTELSSRQGLPTFSVKMLLDFGKEMLLIPALTFQVVKSLSNYLAKAFQSAGLLTWTLFAMAECVLLFTFFFLRKMVSRLLERPSQWRDKINSKWLSLQWLNRNFIDVVVICNTLGVMCFFSVPLQNYVFILYLSSVWLIFKGIMTLARLCLVETTHDAGGHDMRLYRRLKWVILIGGIITALTAFVHQLPLIYEIKALCDSLFLLLLMVVSLFLLRSYDVVPNLILSHMESQHPYLQKSIRLIGVLIPTLMFANSIIGLFGFVNLIMTVSWYEGIFLVVLVGYLILRGLLSDGMEQLSRLMIQYANNGWLWTEAFLKPIDKVLRITLFLVAWAVLFILYGWDKQSPIVERLTRLLQYQLANVLNTTITPISIIELFVVISVFYWTAKWIREFVYRLLLSRTKDMGIRNSIAILSQYSMVVLGAFISLRVLGIDLRALVAIASFFAFGVGLGLRDLANNFASGFLILLERPLRVGDIVSVGGIEGEVTHIGGRAVTVRTWDHMDLVVPNTEIFNKSFTNWTARDNIVRIVTYVKISRYDNPHEVKIIIQTILNLHKEILKDPPPEVFLKEMSDTLVSFEMRYYVNIRQVKSRTSVVSSVLMTIWDEFASHGIKPPYPQHEVFLRGELPTSAPIALLESQENRA
jgi:potassium-dependent mechanosensitive channel